MRRQKRSLGRALTRLGLLTAPPAPGFVFLSVVDLTSLDYGYGYGFKIGLHRSPTSLPLV